MKQTVATVTSTCPANHHSISFSTFFIFPLLVFLLRAWSMHICNAHAFFFQWAQYIWLLLTMMMMMMMMMMMKRQKNSIFFPTLSSVAKSIGWYT